MKKKKLDLKKRTVAILSDVEAAKLVGGAAAVTTSVFSCTGFLCCDTLSPSEMYSTNCHTAANTCGNSTTCSDRCV